MNSGQDTDQLPRSGTQGMRAATGSELIFLKLGGSLLTDKTRARALRQEVLSRLAREIGQALHTRMGLRLLVGHGSGSFGHFVASQYRTRDSVRTDEDWRGYAATATVAAELNRLVTAALDAAGIPALPVQPSASARCQDGELVTLEERPLLAALSNGLVPVVYGDVALDDIRGGTIVSTEQIFRWLAPRLRPNRVVLVGEVEGVLTADPASGWRGELVPEISPGSLPGFAGALGGSRGIDVTGGMVAKVAEMLGMLESTPELEMVQIISGLENGLVASTLQDPTLRAGTRLVRQC